MDSAAHRPKVSVLGQAAYPGLHDKAAVLLESILRNHPLHRRVPVRGGRGAVGPAAIVQRHSGWQWSNPHLLEDVGTRPPVPQSAYQNRDRECLMHVCIVCVWRG
ncbi:hypothetical protein GCM10023214_78340 [Amycolatopsis dongchuanensis]|uniref:Uncharacterized protein n=1 Tax=Amycolatopsis dongchuanensis TaxID=1070866 RepID=A0ABP8VVQ0_9PSEU